MGGSAAILPMRLVNAAKWREAEGNQVLARWTISKLRSTDTGPAGRSRTRSSKTSALHEFGLGRGRIPVVSNGAHIAAPDMRKNLGNDLLEGVMTIVANWGIKGQEEIINEFIAKTGEPWIT
jgi:hypothetical protein